MKKIILIIIAFALSALAIGQTIEGTTVSNTITGEWFGVAISNSVPTNLIYRNNSVTSVNSSGYMLLAGDEAVVSTNNNLKGAVISGNKFTWNGTSMTSITHGIFTGCNIDVKVKYNYLLGVPMGIIRKSASSMTNTTGGVSYNIVKNFNVGGVVKGMNNVYWYNNTFYNSRTTAQTYRPCIDIYENEDTSPTAAAHNTKVKNNIFYTVYKTKAITITTDSRIGFECDYNVYWCEEGDHTPVFEVGGVALSWTQWKALGYDSHSVVMNPNFNNTTDLTPTARLDYGVNLGSEFLTGLSTTATWVTGTSPLTTDQGSTWQVGARVYSTVIPPVVIKKYVKVGFNGMQVIQQ